MAESIEEAGMASEVEWSNEDTKSGDHAHQIAAITKEGLPRLLDRLREIRTPMVQCLPTLDPDLVLGRNYRSKVYRPSGFENEKSPTSTHTSVV